jgi:hypothetical protein
MRRILCEARATRDLAEREAVAAEVAQIVRASGLSKFRIRLQNRYLGVAAIDLSVRRRHAIRVTPDPDAVGVTGRNQSTRMSRRLAGFPDVQANPRPIVSTRHRAVARATGDGFAVDTNVRSSVAE